MGELARRARLSKQTMTTMVPLLEREELVRRERDPEDGAPSHRPHRQGAPVRAVADRALDESARSHGSGSANGGWFLSSSD